MPHETSPHRSWDRRTFLRRTAATVVGAGVLSGTAAADHNKEFNLRPWHEGDDRWDSGKVTTLDDPNEDSLDLVWAFKKTEGVTSTRCPDGGCPVNQWGVVDAAPGDPAYNGGRWLTNMVTIDDKEAYKAIQPIKSEAKVKEAASNGILTIHPETTWPDGPPLYFSCPMIRKIED